MVAFLIFALCSEDESISLLINANGPILCLSERPTAIDA